VSDASFDLFHLIPKCPVCGDRIELVYDRPTAKVCVCVNCHTGITVPARALSIADQQRDPTDASGGRASDATLPDGPLPPDRLRDG
jgi:hypothetical protein